jgi:gas vesicle protein
MRWAVGLVIGPYVGFVAGLMHASRRGDADD